MTLVAVLAAGALGAVGRHLLVVLLEARARHRLPVGVLTANVVGSLVLGLLVGTHLDGTLSTTTLTVLGTGFCGTLTTWSTFVLDVAERVEAGARRQAAAVVAVSLLAGGGAAALGLALGGGG